MRIQVVGDTHPAQVGLNLIEVVPTGLAEVLVDGRGRLLKLLASGILTVEDPKRGLLDAPLAILAEGFLPGSEKLRERFFVEGLTVLVPQRIEGHFQPADLKAPKERIDQDEHLRVDRRIGRAEGLGVHLVELPEAARLGPLVAEHRADGKDLEEPGRMRQVMFNIGSDDRSCGLRTKGNGIAPLVLEGIHLLLNDVGRLAQGAGEEASVLEDGNLDLSVSKGFEQPARFGLHHLPQLYLARKDIFYSPYGSKGHGRLSPRTRGAAGGVPRPSQRVRH